MKKFLLLCIVVLFGLTSQPIIPTYAAVPKFITYQATVIENGQVVNTTTAVTFSLWDAETGGNKIFIEVQSVDIVNSLLNATIGVEEEIILDDNLNFNEQYYLEVQIGDNDALPRTPLTTSPYAMRAENSNFATRAQTAVVAETVAPNSIVLSNLTDEVKNLGGDLVGTLPNPTIRPEAIIENIPNGSIGMDKLAADVTTLPAGPATGDLTGTYPSPLIRNFAITTDKIADFAVNTSKLDAGAVQSNNLGNNSVNTDKIENLSILNEDISNTAAIAGTKIVPNFGNQNIITTGTLTVSNVVTTGANNFSSSTPSPNAVITVTNTGAGHAININAGTDGNALLSNGNIVVNGNVTATNLNGSGSNITNLNGTNITSGTVADARIDGALTRDNESPIGGDITGSYATGLTINTNVINSAKIADGAIVDADVNSVAAIAGTKINPNFGAQNVTTTGIYTGNGSGLTNINGANLTAGSVTTTQILDGTILNADINSAAAIAGSKITPNFGNQNVTTTGIYLGDGSGLTNLNGTNITSGTVADARIASTLTRDNESPIGGDITGSYATGLTINTNAVTTAKIADNNVTEAKLDILNNPTDNFILAYDLATGKMEWIENATTLTSSPLQGNGAVGNPITLSTAGVTANQIWVRNAANNAWVPSLITNNNVTDNSLTVSKINSGAAANGAIMTSNGVGVATWSTALNDGLTAETNARIAADNNLQTQINSNTTSIANITNNLVAETTARIAGDNNLQNQINTINTDIVNKVGKTENPAAGDISGSYTAGFQIVADAVGSAEIAANAVTSSEIADNAVTTSEILDGTVANIDLASGIDAAKINTGIVSNAEFNFLDGATSNIQTQLTTEVTTRAAADVNLQNQIDDINTDLSAFDTRLTTAENDINTLEAGLATEITTRAAADVTLQSQITTNTTNISALTTRVTTAENDINTLEAGLANEITTRAAADVNLQNQINTKMSNALTNGNVFVGNEFNIATGVSLSGDVTISNTGLVAITANAVGSSEITNSSVQNEDLAGGIDALKIGAGLIDNTEFSYLDNATSNIQDQIDNIEDQLNLGTMAYQNSDAVAITGGTINGVTISGGSLTNSNINGTPVGALTPSTGNFTDLDATNIEATDVTTTTLNSDEITTKQVTVNATSNNNGIVINSVDQTALVINVATTEKAIETNGEISTSNLVRSTLGLLAGAINIDGTTNNISGVNSLTTTNLTVSNVFDVKNDNDTFLGVIKNSTSNNALGRVIINDGINQNVNQANNFAGKINADNGLQVTDGGLTISNAGLTMDNSSGNALKLSYFNTTSVGTLEANTASYSVINYTGTGTGVNPANFAAGNNGQIVYIVNSKTTGTLAITNGQTLQNGAVGMFVYASGTWKQVY